MYSSKRAQFFGKVKQHDNGQLSDFFSTLPCRTGVIFAHLRRLDYAKKKYACSAG